MFHSRAEGMRVTATKQNTAAARLSSAIAPPASHTLEPHGIICSTVATATNSLRGSSSTFSFPATFPAAAMARTDGGLTCGRGSGGTEPAITGSGMGHSSPPG
ncbi:hypothetical protein CVS30_01650 [Arthrobacter psychrolactophilus]|uniref:Uncharacterized protein n=1 Tax=Arthrobacter psychrolactophilus TaxID=92442 RepID=A0A2V5IUP8_9MICC|nr:hypothetical protein CVS30_01650 [Arthrobacter psychrolactophilus]